VARWGEGNCDFVLPTPRSDWTEEEDLHLLLRIRKYGKEWVAVSKGFERRDWGACAGRFYRLEHRGIEAMRTTADAASRAPVFSEHDPCVVAKLPFYHPRLSPAGMMALCQQAGPSCLGLCFVQEMLLIKPNSEPRELTSLCHVCG
jgi:hypothetical protein